MESVSKLKPPQPPNSGGLGGEGGKCVTPVKRKETPLSGGVSFLNHSNLYPGGVCVAVGPGVIVGGGSTMGTTLTSVEIE